MSIVNIDLPSDDIDYVAPRFRHVFVFGEDALESMFHKGFSLGSGYKLMFHMRTDPGGSLCYIGC
jgi:hypothetical protein